MNDVCRLVQSLTEKMCNTFAVTTSTCMYSCLNPYNHHIIILCEYDHARRPILNDMPDQPISGFTGSCARNCPFHSHIVLRELQLTTYRSKSVFTIPRKPSWTVDTNTAHLLPFKLNSLWQLLDTWIRCLEHRPESHIAWQIINIIIVHVQQ